MKKRLLLASALAFAVVGIAGWHWQAQAAGTVLVRGVVKPGGASDSINVYITYVASAPDPSAIQGLRTDVNIGKAMKYKWEVKNGVLTKTRTTSNPVPEKEVVIRGTLQDDGRITAAWVVQNYREFEVEGTLQDVTRDTGFTDQGWVTINVTSSKLRGAVPKFPFKEAAIKGKDLRIRINGQTDITALGKTKEFDEVTAGQQKVRVEGQLLNEDSWGASKFLELNS